MPRPCVLYLRSSKDRSDVSPDAQRKILTELAGRRGLAIVREFVDVVLSGKDANRPAFIELRRQVEQRDRGWDVVLMLDFERLARNQRIAKMFEFKCDDHGVQVVYANMPESSPMNDLIVKPLMHGLAEYRSWEAKMKGMAGMRENVARGFRAGGRAPYGYALEHVATGAVREGKAVLKSRLVKTDKSAAIAAYLKGRAQGRKGTELARSLGLEIPRSTLVGMEWNALTYAGHTVWNVHNEVGPGGYKGGGKRRPRTEWAIKRDTHVALITEDEAERILEHLEASPHKGKMRAARSTTAANILSGLLVTRAGRQWHVDRKGRFYRVGTKSILASTVDDVVLAGVTRDLQTPSFLEALVDRTLAALDKEAEADGVAGVDRELGDRERRIGRLTQLVADTDTPAPLLREIERLEAERQALLSRRATAHQKARHAREMRKVSPEDVRRQMTKLADQAKTSAPAELKAFLRELISSVELDPTGASARINYSIRHSGRVSVASPAGFDAYPAVEVHSTVRVPRRRPLSALRKKAA